MLSEVVMPSVGQISKELRITRWCKKVGEQVHKGEPLLEVGTDKAVMEIESYRDGVLLAILHGDGAVVPIGEVIAYIGDEGELPPTIMEEKREDKETAGFEGPKAQTSFQRRDRIFASPLVKRIAQDHGITVEEVARFFSKNVIEKEDVLRFLERKKEGEAEDYRYLELSPLRKTIIQRVTESSFSIPQYTISIDVDMSACISLRERCGKEIAYHDIIMKCAASAIEKYPLINATLEGERAKVYTRVNFGLVVSIEGGIVVPVVRDVGRKSLMQVAQESAEKIARARNNALTPDDVSSGTITLSNLGMYGVDRFTALIRSPESCILAVGQIVERLVWREQRVVPRPMATITASFDHRTIDGAYGAEFLHELRNLLENPWFLLS
ncbi:MAG: dihydrolipoamide acetyltransferase family protein [Candidatus Caldatribacteriaceae bacterium]